MKVSKTFVICVVYMLLAVSSSLCQEQLVVIGWNVQSGGANVDVISERIVNFNGIDIWGLSEVREVWENPFKIATEDGEGADFQSILGSTGRGDRLQIIFDADRFELLGSEELHEINPQNRVRSPLVAHFRITASGDEFLFMVNHLYRTNETARHRQSSQLNDWAEQQTLPMIAVGDYNYDWRVVGGENDHDAGFDFLIDDGVFNWLRPAPLVRTQYSTRYPHSVLDFIFLANADGQLGGTSEIIISAGDFPDDGSTPDHRPVQATLAFGNVGGVNATIRDRILQRISALERELVQLRSLVQTLPN